MSSLSDSENGHRYSIAVEDLSVVYRTTIEKKPTLKSTMLRLGRRERVVREIPAVTDVSLEVERGTVLGVVGTNGAGKSTLVRAMAGILPPSSGRVVVNGRVSTLLALGVGFNRNLTGRENVVLGGLAAGYTREEMEARYDKIVRFAELGDFMDLPMRTYSSGMYSRLGFSVAVNMDPDILLIDEALAVGDTRFRKKSFRRMRKLCRQEKTIVLVSHSLGSIRKLSDKVVWMQDGRVQMVDEPDVVVDAYEKYLGVDDDDDDAELDLDEDA